MVLSTKALAFDRGSKVSGKSLRGHYELWFMRYGYGLGGNWLCERKSTVSGRFKEEKGNVAPFKKLNSSCLRKEGVRHFVDPLDVKLPSLGGDGGQLTDQFLRTEMKRGRRGDVQRL